MLNERADGKAHQELTNKLYTEIGIIAKAKADAEVPAGEGPLVPVGDDIKEEALKWILKYLGG